MLLDLWAGVWVGREWKGDMKFGIVGFWIMMASAEKVIRTLENCNSMWCSPALDSPLDPRLGPWVPSKAGARVAETGENPVCGRDLGRCGMLAWELLGKAVMQDGMPE